MQHRLVTAVILGLAFVARATAGPIDRVEPPFWWQGFEHTALQLLVHGHGISEFDALIDHPSIAVSRVERVASSNYLFIYINIDADAEPGSFDIVFESDNLRFTHAYELREKKVDPAHARGFSPADTIYLITPDRFANGDTSNDTVPGLGDPVNRDDDFGRHGGDIAGVKASLDYLVDLGFTAIWLNPVLENAMPKASYHGYATTDFYKVDQRFGSNEEYRELAEEARAKGLGLIMDMIINHSGSEHWWMDDLPTADWLNLPEKRTRTSHARTTNQDPYASTYDKATHTDGWFVPTMPDLNQRNPLLADYLTQNAIWWIEYLGLTGIRMDTHPYPDKHYMSEWSRRIMQEYPNFNLTGEEWSKNPAIVSYWQRGKKNHDGYVSSMPSMLDFPIQIALHEVLTAEEPRWGSVWTPVYEMLGNDFLYPDPGNLVIFPDNHDMSRIYTQVDEDYDLYKMAIVYYLTMRGIPAIYYGTEVLMSHPGTGSHGAIRAEFPGGWADHKKNAFTGEGLSDQELEAQSFMRRLLNWRKDKNVIHSGHLMQFTPIKNVYAYFRYDNQEMIMVIMNRGEDSATLDLERFDERLTGMRRATDVITGREFELGGSIELTPRSVLLLEVDH
jgi:glycosidase